VADLTSTLLNELDRIEQPCIMVLDDYHLIKETMVHDLLTELLKHPSPSLHLAGRIPFCRFPRCVPKVL
jgi:ATP/maltotriose-dependent transcriptional regulator MalT